MSAPYVGLMSGTSLDGVDAVLVSFDAGGERRLEVLGHVHVAFEAGLAAELLALNSSGSDELHRAALAGNALVRAYADAVTALLDKAKVTRQQVRAIGAHGQTVRHRPGAFDGIGYTLQLNQPALLAEYCGIDVVADFRSRDVAAGGQGAPLVPAFHREVFGVPGSDVAVLNLGGMSNLTLIGATGATIGFDCGPGNALMDGWIARHRGEAFDVDGGWAASGRVDDPLLARLRADPFFALPPPKSTGRDDFHLGWLDAALAGLPPRVPQDVQATLAELTASVCADALLRQAPAATRLVVCGGGARNRHLMARLGARLAMPVSPSDAFGLGADQVEACAFAWLAHAHVERRTGSLASVTGARGDRILGALYPA
jgi:anhydro-N-acetylmuramic acid kinase